MGIQGNEHAEKEAKISINEPLNTSIYSPPEEIKKYININMKKFWDSRWKNNESNKLQEIRPSIFDKLHTWTTSRKQQVTIDRLRIGHTNLTHILLITKQQRNKCEKCGSAWTVKHLIVECQVFELERTQSKLP